MAPRTRLTVAILLGLAAIVVPAALVTVRASAETIWVAPVNAPIWDTFRPESRPYHDGVDIGADRWVPIKAASAGEVIQSKCNAHINGEPYPCDEDGSPTVRGCGWYIDILHPGGYATRYCHMVVAPLVEIGDEVETGQIVGYVGSSGNSSAPHLHFEVHEVSANGELTSANAIDPIAFMTERGAPLGRGKDRAIVPPTVEPPTPPEVPLPHEARVDLTADGLSDLVAWRPAQGQWYVPSPTGSEPVLAAPVVLDDGVSVVEEVGFPVELGAHGDIPVVGDYDGDRLDDLAVWRPRDGRWLVQTTSGVPVSDPVHGTEGDFPVPADYDGDGRTDYAVWRPFTGEWLILRADGSAADTVFWGTVGDLPVVADYDADGKADIAVWRPLDGQWYILPSSGIELPVIILGAGGDFPVPGDYDGDGLYDYAVWRPSEGAWHLRYAVNTAAEEPIEFGTSGDTPVVGDYDGDAVDDLALWRASEGRWLIRSSVDGVLIDVRHRERGDIPASRPLWIDNADGNPITAADLLSLRLRIVLEQTANGTTSTPAS